MTEFDIFDLTGLVFDPAETNARKVLIAIDKADKDIGGLLGSETQTARRDEMNRQRTFLADAKTKFIEPDGKKVTQLYRDKAKERTDVEINKLRASVVLMAQTGQKAVTEGFIKRQKQGGVRLDVKNIEKVYRDVGFDIQPTAKASKPDFPVNADKIYDLLKTIRELPNYRTFYPGQADNTKVDTLYAFVAYLEDEPENVVEYRSKLTEELAKLLDTHATKNATRVEDKRDPLALVIKDLISLSKSNVFNNDANRAKYEKHLLYKRPQMTDLFESLKTAKQTGADLEDPKVAEPVIKKIGDVFGDRDEAIIIYNFVAGIIYEPVKPIFYVKCAHCQNTSEFESAELAKRSNKCTHCAKALYKLCSRCSKPVLDSSEKCPECGFMFASIAMFTRYMSLAEQALREGSFDDARQYLSRAKTADPGEKTCTAELDSRISKEEAVYQKPINELRQLVNDRKFMAASQALSRTISNFPKLNVATFEAQIKSALAKANATFEAARKQPPSDCANICFDILDSCVDFKPALDFLAVTAPTPVKNLTAALDKANCWANVNWMRTGEKGITYRIIRKSGKDTPKNELDGEMLKDNFDETAFRDETIPPGSWFSYGVFAKRKGVYSTVVSVSVLLLAEVTDVRYEQNGTTVRITWNLPRNCTGVKITRTYNGMEAMLTDNAQTSFEDRGLEYGASYSYTLRANYLGQQLSAGTSIPITPLVKVDAFSINAKQLKGSKYNISWKIPHREIDLRVLVNKRVFRDVKSDAGSCEIELPLNGYHVVEVAAYSAGSWINSTNSIEVNTYAPLEINREATVLTEKPISGVGGSYKISIPVIVAGTIPGNVAGFYYTVRTKGASASNAPWATLDEIDTSSDVIRVDISKYRKDDKIIYHTNAKSEDAFYITLFTEYSIDGKVVISDPHKRRVDRPVLATVLWKVSKSLFGKPRLHIETVPNRQIIRLPRFVLCGSNGGRLLSLSDSKAEVIMEISCQELDTPLGVYKNEYEITSPVGKNTRLFLFSDGANKSEVFTTKWASGFQGKL